MTTFTESVVEEAALAWLESVGWQVRNGAEMAPGEPASERDDYGQVVLAQRLRDALWRLNPALPAEALEDAFRKLTRSEGADLIMRNRALHRLLVDGVTVEYRDADGSIRGAQVRVIDFEHPDHNDWLAVNQFSVVENKHARWAGVVQALAHHHRRGLGHGSKAAALERALAAVGLRLTVEVQAAT
jgi:type I restriction enzyme R subunit